VNVIAVKKVVVPVVKKEDSVCCSECKCAECCESENCECCK
jgi:hypothetical protein